MSDTDARNLARLNSTAGNSVIGLRPARRSRRIVVELIHLEAAIDTGDLRRAAGLPHPTDVMLGEA